ncbi:PLP-dependent aminotransferase family protein [Brevibacillus choshinensis]|uniref:PLP-dependent aminotransferase family protein n=1 Tax=Brevibacillus choshinensis TaxID=54911 RepID=A0ABX7FNS5_BRECH|nr:PLP-dependent aminotransferase family protein [Brevibacillus choshinensis]QRG66640.1 PLP-dependent aminotransferase family protein [Brevibacillus choshinensis]
MENKYEVVKALLKEQLLSSAIKPGEKLPSIRAATELWSCSKNTAIRAYQELEKEHLIYSVPKSGYYAVLRTSPSKQTAADWIDFSSASPDADVMPYKDFQHCLNRAIELYEDHLFSYSDPQGFFTLRRALEGHLANSQIFAPPSQICVVSGAQQALHVLASMPFPNGKAAVLVEQPSFQGMLRSLDLLGVTTLGIERTMDGIDLDELERHFRNNHIKFFYTVPRFHNPLGASYTQEQKMRIAKLAEKYDVYIVEDDYLADMDPDEKADPIYSYDQAGKVVYVKSFSKIMLPGLRLASVVLPTSLMETFRLFKASSDSSTAALSQAALELYLNCGMYDHHASLVRDRYRLRMQQLAECSKHLLPPQIDFRIGVGGIFARMSIPEEIDLHDLITSLYQQQVRVTSTEHNYLRTFRRENGLRISIIQTDSAKIEKGIQIVANTIEGLLEQKHTSRLQVIDWI